MSKPIQFLRLCVQCAESLIGYLVIRENDIEDQNGKCELCKKKKPTYVYRIMSERSRKPVD